MILSARACAAANWLFAAVGAWRSRARRTRCWAMSRSTVRRADGCLQRDAQASGSPCATPARCAIVEGVGDHGCEYMTGGLAVVLGRDRHQFRRRHDRRTGVGVRRRRRVPRQGAAITRSFCSRNHGREFDEEARDSIRELVALHASKTQSTRARWLLSNWEREAKKFVRLTPKLQG